MGLMDDMLKKAQEELKPIFDAKFREMMDKLDRMERKQDEILALFRTHKKG